MQKELYRGERYPMCDLCEPGIERAGAVLIGVNLVGECGKEPAIEPSEPVRLQDLLCGGQCCEATTANTDVRGGSVSSSSTVGLVYTRIDVNSLGL